MTSTRDISVGLQTRAEAPHLRASLAALALQPWREVVIADVSSAGEERERLYREFASQLPLRVLRLAPGTAAGAARNAVVQHCTAPYLLMLDDDQLVPSNVGRLAEVLDEQPVIGGVAAVGFEAGRHTCAACDVRLVGSEVVKDICEHHPVRHTAPGQRYVTFDVIPSPTLFRTACLAELAWDPSDPASADDLGFYFSHQRLGRWLFAVSLDVVVERRGCAQQVGKRRQRRSETSARYFQQKFGVSRVVEGRKGRDAWSSIAGVTTPA